MNKLAFLIPFSALFTSCGHHYYLPTAHNVPLLEKAGDARVEGSYGVGEKIAAAELRTAYAVTNHFGVMLNGMYGYGGNKKPTFNDKGEVKFHDFGSGKMVEAGAGAFAKLGKSFVVEAMVAWVLAIKNITTLATMFSILL